MVSCVPWIFLLLPLAARPKHSVNTPQKMGGSSSKEEKDESAHDKVYDPKRIYYDHHGNLRYGAVKLVQLSEPLNVDANSADGICIS